MKESLRVSSSNKNEFLQIRYCVYALQLARLSMTPPRQRGGLREPQTPLLAMPRTWLERSWETRSLRPRVMPRQQVNEINVSHGCVNFHWS